VEEEERGREMGNSWVSTYDSESESDRIAGRLIWAFGDLQVQG